LTLRTFLQLAAWNYSALKNAIRQPADLVPEMASSRENHRHCMSITGRDHFVIAPGPSGLNNGRDARCSCAFDRVLKREECIGSKDGAAGALASLADRNLHRIDTTHLTGPDADGCLILH
jgi:hypothetical protein